MHFLYSHIHSLVNRDRLGADIASAIYFYSHVPLLRPQEIPASYSCRPNNIVIAVQVRLSLVHVRVYVWERD